jgi:stage V sporulation protein B
MDFIVKPVIAVAVMSAIVYGAYANTESILGGNKATLVSILAGAAVYAVMLLAIGAISKKDFELMPGGRKISKVLSKLKLLRG